VLQVKSFLSPSPASKFFVIIRCQRRIYQYEDGERENKVPAVDGGNRANLEPVSDASYSRNASPLVDFWFWPCPLAPRLRLPRSQIGMALARCSPRIDKDLVSGNSAKIRAKEQLLPDRAQAPLKCPPRVRGMVGFGEKNSVCAPKPALFFPPFHSNIGIPHHESLPTASSFPIMSPVTNVNRIDDESRSRRQEPIL
jgi:hypothetical protein